MAVSGLRFARTVHLGWDANPAGDNVIAYNIYWGSATGTYNSPESPATVAADITDVRLPVFATGQTVYMAITAENAQGESDFSSEVSR